MSTEPLVAIISLYGSVMCGAMAVLIWAFKDESNSSGRLFLFSETLRIPTLIALGVLNPDQSTRSFTIYVVGPFYMLAEITFIYSLSALARDQIQKHLKQVLSSTLFLCVVAEAIRFEYATLHLSVYLLMLAGASASAIRICTHTQDQGLRNAPFWRILKYVEFLFLVISVTRLIFLLLGITITPTEGGLPSIILLSMMFTLLIFRSFCYQSVWMTWASPHAKENQLNRSLLQTFRERDVLFKRLTASNRRIGVSALASSIAHQLSQPLTGAALHAEAIKQRMTHRNSETDVLQGIQKISDILGHLSSVVRNLKSLFGVQDDKLQELMLDSLCLEVIKFVEFSEKASELKIQISGHLKFPILGNPIQIQQIIVNLIDNAIQASENASTKEVKIMFTEQKGKTSLTVRDHGSGFSPEALNSLFDLYQTTKPDGTGIGLWLSRQIVEKHRGDIKISNHPNGGACVTIEFPTVMAL